ncbi:pilus assembly protein PilM [Candidatus Parcubacteria bacterium]|nr:pilus assembly protein PilM [Candidatus Parcubacteria bacterium]
MVSHVPSMVERKKGFFDFFPPPKFLLLSTEGVAVSDAGIQFVQFDKASKKGGFALLHCAELALPDGIVVNGAVANKESLVKSLEELRARYHLRYVHVTFPEEKAYVFTTTIEKVQYAGLRDAIAFTIEENVPVSLSESVFDFDIVGATEERGEIKVAVSVLPAEVMQSYLEVYSLAGLIPISFDIESQAIARALVPRDDPRTHLIINLNEKKSGLYVAEDGVVQFSSTLPLGVGTASGGDVAGLKSEMRKLFAFWNTRIDKDGTPGKRIERILFSGIGAKNEEFIGELMSGIEIDYAVGNVWVNAFSFEEFVPDVPFEESLSLAGAVGAALPVNEADYV